MEYSVQKILTPYIYNDIADIYNADSFDCFRNKTVFITGASGLIGYYLACAFLIGNDIDSNNTKVIVCDREETLFEKYGNLNCRTDIDFLVSKDFSNLPREKADFIIHTDCNGGRDYFEAMVNLLNYGQQANIVLCSDMSIFGTVYNGKSKLSEEDCGYIDLANADIYSVQSQRMVEAYGKKLASENNLNIKFARICSVLGAFGLSPLNKLTPVGSDAVATGMQIMADNAETVQSYCYVTDMATALVKILTHGKTGEVYNVSTGCDTSMKYITEACLKHLPHLNVAYKNNKNNNNSPMNCTNFILDNSKLLSLGFTPKVSLEESIRRMVNNMQNNL